MNRILQLDEAHQLTRSFHDLWTEVTLEAWDIWQKFQISDDFASAAQTFDSGMRFQLLTRIIGGKVAEKTNAVRFNVGGPGLLLQPIGDDVFVRFKHVNGSNLRPCSYATNLQTALQRQELR